MKERVIESNFEKYGGGALAILGAIAGDFPVVALGLGLAIIGLFRTPEKERG